MIILICKDILIFAGNMYPLLESDTKIRNHGTFKLLTSVVCSKLSQIGDNSLVFQTLEKVILEQIVS
jgi:pre-rRNA-processing protein IPI1